MGEKLGWKSLTPKQRAWKESIDKKILSSRNIAPSGPLPSNAIPAISPAASVAPQALTQDQKDKIASNRLAALEKKWHIQEFRAAVQRHKLGSWEVSFYEDVFARVCTIQGFKLSEKQQLHRDKIEQKILGGA